MPITANAKKALRQQKTRTARNHVLRAQVRTMVKKAVKQPEQSILSQLFAVVDRAVKKHVLHKNKAARIKSQVVKQADAAPEAEAAKKTAKKPAKKTVKKVVKKTTKKTAAKS